MELKHFRLIKSIVEEGSIANSSEKLFLTQSALSHQLRILEERLGFKVFFRTRNKWELTKEGQELYTLANELFNKIDAGFSKIKHINQGTKGTIRFSTECYSFYHGLPKFIQKMGVLYPEIKVEVSLGATHQPIPKLLSNDIDIAITTIRFDAPELEYIEFQEDELLCIMHKEHPLAYKNWLEATDFSKSHLIIHSFPIESVAVHRHYLKPNSITPKKISAIPFTAVALEMVNANMGIMCIPNWNLDAFKVPEELIRKKIGQHGLKRQQYLAYRKSDRDLHSLQEFIQNFIDDFKNP